MAKGAGQQGDAAGQLCRELELAGAESLLTLDSEGTLAGGVTLLADARSMHRSAAAAAQFRQQVFDVLVSELPLSVSICGLSETTTANELLARVCSVLRLAALDAGVRPRSVEIVVDVESILPRTATRLRREHLGEGVVRIRAGEPSMRDGELWRQLWWARDAGCVWPTYATHVLSPCPLLRAESATAVTPATGVQIPLGSAWLPLRLDVSQFVSHRGSMNEVAVEHALRRCVELGDRLHELIRWPTAQMRHDAWLNRRLAVIITGLGDLALRRQLDPRRFTSLDQVSQLLLWMRDVLLDRSRAIARTHRHLPALDEGDPSRALPGGTTRNQWHERWLGAVDDVAIRHRNLLVLSPWAIFPSGGPADYCYSDLLPLLRFADACALPPPPDLSCWNLNQFKEFHRYAWAVLQQRNTEHQIAVET